MTPAEIKLMIGIMVIACLGIVGCIVQMAFDYVQRRRMLKDPAVAVLLSALQLAGIAERARRAMATEIADSDGADR
jgi:hypothetical protein